MVTTLSGPEDWDWDTELMMTMAERCCRRSRHEEDNPIADAVQAELHTPVGRDVVEVVKGGECWILGVVTMLHRVTLGPLIGEELGAVVGIAAGCQGEGSHCIGLNTAGITEVVDVVVQERKVWNMPTSCLARRRASSTRDNHLVEEPKERHALSLFGPVQVYTDH